MNPAGARREGETPALIPRLWTALIFMILGSVVLGAFAPRSLFALVPLLAILSAPVVWTLKSDDWRDWARNLLRFPMNGSLALCALMAASWLWALFPAITLAYILKTVPLILCCGLVLVIARNAPPAQAALFNRFWPAAVIASGVVCFADIYGQGAVYKMLHSQSSEAYRPSVSNRGTLVFMLSSLTLWPVLLQPLALSRRTNRFIIAALLALTLSVFMGTDSQSVQMALFAAAIFYVFFPCRSAWAWHGLIAGIVAGILSAPWLAQMMFHVLAAKAENMPWISQAYVANRMEIWDFISQKILERPLTGFGVEATRAIRDFHTAQIFQKSDTILHPHNFVLQIWIELGLPGALLLSWFIAKTLLAVKNLGPVRSRLCLPALMAVLLVACTSYGLWQGWWVALLGLLPAYAILLQNQAEEENTAPK